VPTSGFSSFCQRLHRFFIVSSVVLAAFCPAPPLHAGSRPGVARLDKAQVDRQSVATTTIVESRVNPVIGRRMAKKQPMRWSRYGATCWAKFDWPCSQAGACRTYSKAGTRGLSSPVPSPLNTTRGLFHFLPRCT